MPRHFRQVPLHHPDIYPPWSVERGPKSKNWQQSDGSVARGEKRAWRDRRDAIVSAEVDVNTQDQDDQTPLGWAVVNGHATVVVSLVPQSQC